MAQHTTRMMAVTVGAHEKPDPRPRSDGAKGLGFWVRVSGLRHWVCAIGPEHEVEDGARGRLATYEP